jgi:NAD(P)H-dependent FMN reductase
VRERRYSRFLTLEAERLLQHFGAETRIFDAQSLPLPAHSRDGDQWFHTIMITRSGDRDHRQL